MKGKKMSNHSSNGRLIAAHIRNHSEGSKAFETYGSQSLTVKVVKAGGLPTDTQEDCILAAKRAIAAAIKAKLPCSAIYFAHLSEAGIDQPTDANAVALQLEESIDEGYDVWLSKRGGLTVGTNTTGQHKAKAKRSAGPALSKAQNAAITAFLKA